MWPQLERVVALSAKARQKKDVHAISEKQATESGDRLYKSCERKGEWKETGVWSSGKGREMQETGSQPPFHRHLVMFGLQCFAPIGSKSCRSIGLGV